MDRVDVLILSVALGVTIGLGMLSEHAGLGPLPGILLATGLIILFTRVVRP